MRDDLRDEIAQALREAGPDESDRVDAVLEAVQPLLDVMGDNYDQMREERDRALDRIAALERRSGGIR